MKRGCIVWLMPGAQRGDAVLARAVRAWGGAPRRWTLQRWCGACRVWGHGRPVLPWPDAPAASVAYTTGMAAVALADATPVGVDVEQCVPRPRLAALASFVWSDAERPAFKHRPFRTLYLDWARKEAVLKAHAVGLSVPMSSFSVASELIHLPGRSPLQVRDVYSTECRGVAIAVATSPGVPVELRVEPSAHP